MKRIFYPLILLVTTLALCSQLSAQTYTIFGGGPPGNANDANGGVPIIVGTKFYVTQIGDVTGFRVYRGTGLAGTFVAHLWLDNGDNTGTLITSETFTPTTTDAWNDFAFTTPATITPGNSYVISYYSSTGTYASASGYFNNGGTDLGANPIWGYSVDNAPPPGNGVYISGPATDTEFPNTFFPGPPPGSAYFIDAIFDPLFPLPVTLVDFKANVSSKNVGLTWATASEENNKGFEIQRSNNNVDWYTVGFVASKGNGSTAQNYSYTDKELASGKYYYRLRQVDIDSRVKLSSTVLASITGRGQTSLFQNAPNPVMAGGYTTIRFDLPEDQRTRISVLDLTGREVKLVLDKTAQQGSHIISFDVSGLSKQMYIIRMQTTNEVITRKMLIQ